MEIQVLGDVQIHGRNGPVALRRDKERLLLAVLAINVGKVIPSQQFYDMLGEDGTDMNDRTLVDYMSAVRGALEAAGGKDAPLPPRDRHGYVLTVRPEVVDYHRFLKRVDEAQLCLGASDVLAAISSYKAALGLWRDPALGGIKAPRAEGLRQVMNNEHDNAMYDLLLLQLQTGDNAAVYASVTERIHNEIPTDRMIGLGLHALAQDARHAEIKVFYEQAARRMKMTAGASPSKKVHELARTLRDNPAASNALLAASQIPARAQQAGGRVAVDPSPERSTKLARRSSDLEVASLGSTDPSTDISDAGAEPHAPVGPLSMNELKVEFCRRLASSWQELADFLCIPPYECARFPQGHEARHIWEWLEVRGSLVALRGALVKMRRSDLVDLFDLTDPG